MLKDRQKSRQYTKTVSINRNDPGTFPPEDGTYITVVTSGAFGTTAAVFDLQLRRWFTGKGAALNARSIIAWEKPL